MASHKNSRYDTYGIMFFAYKNGVAPYGLLMCLDVDI
jgi:hypothetical protein